MLDDFKIKILGAYGSKSDEYELSSFQITKSTVIDAGNLIGALKDDAKYIKNIFITHSHLDHIKDIPFLIDSFFEIQKETIKVYATPYTIKNLKEHIFNWEIWPDFSNISLLDSKDAAIEFVEMELNQPIVIDNMTIEAIENNHCKGSCGFVITKDEASILITSDTYTCSSIWKRINSDKKIKAFITETSFPSELEQLSIASKHFTPKLLEEELAKLERDDVRIYVNHLKANYVQKIKEEISNIEKFDIEVLDSMEDITVI
jgi:cAMP phosphodiesterase